MEIRMSSLQVFLQFIPVAASRKLEWGVSKFSLWGYVKQDMTGRASVRGNLEHTLSDTVDVRSRKVLYCLWVSQLIFWLVYALINILPKETFLDHNVKKPFDEPKWETDDIYYITRAAINSCIWPGHSLSNPNNLTSSPLKINLSSYEPN